MPKYPILLSFYSELNKFNNINPRKGRTKDQKVTVYDNSSKLMTVSDVRKQKLGDQYDPKE